MKKNNNFDNVVSEQKIALNLALQLRFLQALKSDKSAYSLDDVLYKYEILFGEGSFDLNNIKQMITNCVEAFENMLAYIRLGSTCLSAEELSESQEFNDAVFVQKNILNLALELKFIQGLLEKEKNKKALLSLDTLEEMSRSSYDAIFGKGESEGKTIPYLVNRLASRCETYSYSAVGKEK